MFPLGGVRRRLPWLPLASSVAAGAWCADCSAREPEYDSARNASATARTLSGFESTLPSAARQSPREVRPPGTCCSSCSQDHDAFEQGLRPVLGQTVFHPSTCFIEVDGSPTPTRVIPPSPRTLSRPSDRDGHRRPARGIAAPSPSLSAAGHDSASIVALRMADVRAQLQAFALSLPNVSEDFPWGERVAKVNGKVFVFLGPDEQNGPPLMTVKLVESHGHALAVEGAEPTGYDLGRSGWVNVPLRAEGVTLDLLRDWIEESYRIVAPKRLIAELDRLR